MRGAKDEFMEDEASNISLFLPLFRIFLIIFLLIPKKVQSESK
jgi:hypothetical protein